MPKLLSLTFLLYTNLEKLLQFPQLYLTKHQFAGYPHTHHDNFSWSKARLMREIFPVRYKIMNSQKKGRSTDATSFSVKQEREHCSQEMEQGSSFQTTSFEWSWAIKECGNFFICIHFSICFWHNQIQLGTGTWRAKVTPKCLWRESVQPIIHVHKYWRISSLLRKYHSSLEQGG